MTELEIMQRAQMYVDKLANGINPLTDEHVDDDEIINNVRISRCLFYVSKVLNQVIENGGKVTNSHGERTRAKFFITNEQLLQIQPLPATSYISDIAKEINRVTEENNTRKFQPAWINEWLLEIGMLEIIDGKKHSTQQGNDIGITTEQRNSMKVGIYYANIFSSDAQTFIYDNIQAIIDYHYSKTK